MYGARALRPDPPRLSRLAAWLALPTLLAFVLALAWAGIARAQEGDPLPAVLPAVPLADYQVALESALAALDEPGAKAGLAAARSVLASYHQVLLPGGATVAVEPLLGGDGESLTVEAARIRLSTVLTQLRASAGDDTAARRQVLDAILAGPAFQSSDSLLDRFLRWIAEWWERLFPRQSSSPAADVVSQRTTEFTAWVVGIAGMIAAVLLLAYWLRGFLSTMVANAELAGDDAADVALPQTPAEARRRANSEAQAGNYREAVRNLYLSALLTLEQRGLVAGDRSLTNRELLARVDAGHPLRPHLKPVVETFDEVWYGVREPDDRTYGQYTTEIDELESLARRADQEPDR